MYLSSAEKALLGFLSLFLMMGIGSTLSWNDFKPVLKKPKGLIIGLISQYGWMPLIAFCLAKLFSLSNEYSIGLILVGSIPGGTSSNFLTYWAKGDTALSIVMTISSTITSIIMLPLLLYFYTRPFTDADLMIPYKNITMALGIVVVPVFLGMWVKKISPLWAARLAKLGNIFGILIIISMTIIWIPKFSGRIVNTHYSQLIPPLIMAYFGFFMGHLLSTLLRLPIPQRRAIALETGMQNAPIAFAIILLSFPPIVAEKILWLPLIYGMMVIQNGVIAAIFFRLFPVKS